MLRNNEAEIEIHVQQRKSVKLNRIKGDIKI